MIKTLSFLSVLISLMGQSSVSFAADPMKQAAICKDGHSVQDTGFYSTFMGLIRQQKIVDTYSVFYNKLSADLEKRAGQECGAGKSNQEIIQALDVACHNHCSTQGPPFIKSLGWFKGRHLVSECHEVCSETTKANKADIDQANDAGGTDTGSAQ